MPDLIDVVLEGFKRIVAWIIGLFMDALREGYRNLVLELFGTPTPNTDGAFVFGTPVNEPWITIREALVGGEILVTALLLLIICIQGRHTLRIFNIGGAYEARKAKKTAWAGAFLIITWYWVAVLTLYLVDGFTIALIPNLDSVSNAMLKFLKGSFANPALAFTLAVIGGISIWALQALFFIREILLYVYLYGMPVAFALAFGNVPVLSDIAMGFAKRFIPLAVLPLPAAILFKGYDLLFGSEIISPATLFLKYIVAVSLPLLALYLSWKTFQYSAPLTARVLGGATKGAILVGGVAAGASVGGAHVGSTAARWGPKAAASQVVAQRVAARGDQTESDGDEAPSYRRTENDPGGSSTSSESRKSGMAFDRGIH